MTGPLSQLGQLPWVALETVIQSSEKQISYICVYISYTHAESRKMVHMNLFARQKQRHRSGEQMYAHQEGRGGAGRVDWEIGIDIYTLPILCTIK